MRRGAKPRKAKAKAKPPVARKSLKSADSRVRDLEKRLAEALTLRTGALKREADILEQQTATGEILRVISQSLTDIQPVLDAVAASAARLCEAFDAAIWRRDGDRVLLAAHHGAMPEDPIGKFSLPLVGSFVGRSVLDGRTIHSRDVQTEVDKFPATSEHARRIGFRAVLCVPLMREGVAIGSIALRRTEAELFTDRQVALLQTFADQAVIAIENVRLFKELEARNREVTEALDQKSATSEILRVIASSPTDLQPVFDTIAERAARLCEAQYCFVYRFEGQLLHFVAHHGLTAEVLEINRRAYPAPPGRKSVAARAVLERSVVQIPDVNADPDYALRAMAAAGGYRSAAAVPILRDGLPIGSIAVTRAQAGPLPDRQIDLLKTFADQAVIAIENVRLFTELQEKNRALTESHAQVTESLEQQTATAEILRVISRSQTDVQPVFDTIVRSSVRLCDGLFSALLQFDGKLIRQVAQHNFTPEALEAAHSMYPVRPSRGSGAGRAILERAVVRIPDVEVDPEFQYQAVPRTIGWRSGLFVPMLREGAPIGVIMVARAKPGPFSDNEVELLKTFAEQAVIAIENVRLFTELEGRNRDLTATSEILRVISSSPTDVEPVFDTIIRSAVRLCNGQQGTAWRFDGELMYLAAHDNLTPENLQIIHQMSPMRPDSQLTSARAILTRGVVHVEDVLADPEYAHPVARAGGFRSVLAVPMLREANSIGAIVVHREQAGPFPAAQIELLKTFADQAVIAIENVRLFTELQTSNRELTTALDQQTATSDILRVISQSQTDVQPVFDAILASAIRLLTGFTGALTRLEGDQIMLVALTSTDDASDAAVRAAFPQWLHAGGAHPQTARGRVPLNVADAHSDARLMGPEGTYAKVRGYQSLVVVPLLRHDEAIGTLSVTRRGPGGFTDDEIALLQTFADQAVIAIENVRLFNELEGRNRDLTATSEILRVISSSPTDVQPVFDTIVRSAVRLCDGLFSALHQFDGELLHLVAHHNYSPEALEEVRRLYPARPSQGQGFGRAILERELVHIPDVEVDPEYQAQALSRAIGFRSGLFVPMLREGVPIGAIMVARAKPGPFSDNEIELLKTFADQAVIAIENVRLFTELQASNRDLTSALDTQTATSDILGVISRSPTNVQPVFDAIVASAVRLLRGYTGALTRIAGDQLELAALTSTDAAGAVVRAHYPQSLQSENPAAQVIRDRVPLNIADAHIDPRVPESVHATARARGYRSSVTVPLLRPDGVVGTIAVTRQEPGGFTDDEIALLKTFADQAVIAIENVRLFNELEGRNRDLTATSEILRVISSSPTDVQPVFDTIVQAARALCGADSAAALSYDGEQLQIESLDNPNRERADALRQVYPMPANRGHATGRAILTGRPVHILDVREDPEYALDALRDTVDLRSVASVPMVRDGASLGAITVQWWTTPRSFSNKQISLLQTFADQAVIAIENVRLFKELEARNRDLTESLEQQTATADILRIISRSQTDVQPVFDTIVRSAVRLCSGLFGALFQFDGELIHHVAQHNHTPEALEAAHRVYPTRLSRSVMPGRAILERAVVHIPDVKLDPEFQQHALSRAVGFRSGLYVPMLREGAPIGVIVVNRAEAGPFSDSEIELLKTFADQAVIAIENVRLFTELEGRNRDLTATSEILQVISSSPTDVQPVFDIIAERAVRLCDGLLGGVYRFDGRLIHFVAHYNWTPEGLETVQRVYPRVPSRETQVSTAILDGTVVEVRDFDAPGVPPSSVPLARALGYRSILAIPMLRHGKPIGAIAVARAEPGPFSDSEIELLKTFADQAVIAVENVRLFNELQARTGELTQSVEQLMALSEVSRAVSSTLDVETVLDTIVSRASQLANADGCSIFEYDEAAEQFELRATHNDDADFVEALRAVPLRKGEGLMGRAAEMREPVQVADITQPGAYQSSARDTLIRFGYRAVLSVPLLREDQIIGSLSFNRKAPGEFPPEVVDVLKTFATQSALAIQNARLFREIADKSAQLEAASRHKSEFLANMSHELRTPLNAIIGFSEVLVDRMFGELTEKQDEYLKDIYASGQHLLSLINDILDLSKIEAGRMELEATDFDLPSAIDNALILVRERAGRRGIKLGSTIDERLGMIAGDERKVKQVLLNLLSNALKFTPEGGRIDVSTKVHDEVAEVSVTDTGVGIAPEDQEAVFEEFRQVGTADKKVEGTGLGLALSRKFIELHGGRIWVKSQVGHGSTFTFTLPVRREE